VNRSGGETDEAKVLRASSGILYVRAALKPLAREMRRAGGIVPMLRQIGSFDELFVPHFYGARPFWRPKPAAGLPPATNSGALGKAVAAEPGAVVSAHPTHAFAGFGPRVVDVLRRHDGSKPCFFPVGELADRHECSMLLLGCVDDSPGFSTVHVAQQRLGLTRKHLIRLLLRWDEARGERIASRTAAESPGCSRSFGKFYAHYEADGNLASGTLGGVPYLWIPSARRALAIETALLSRSGRFVECGRLSCLSCRLRWY
jgi:aminoglycoside 3-N-acetyltransferase